MNESDLKYYIDNKELINEKHCSIIERKGEFAGLRNHGATCYLNSLIQCLFHNSAFVKLILETTDNPDSAIITELKKLFSRLIMSTNQAIDAQALLTAFGWSKAEMFEQHDIHELFSVLIEALGKESPHLNSEINKLFTGHLTDVLKCSSCSHESKNPSSFLNFSLAMPENNTESSCQLTELFMKHLKSEVLDAENMWLCSNCQTKVCATKSQLYESLPKSMMVHLKRFRFDPATKQRRKVCTPVHFPLTLSADQVFQANTTAAATSQLGTYVLNSIVIHSGTAMGGHYRSYINTTSSSTTTTATTDSTTTSTWIDCNDATVTPLTLEDVTQMFATPTTNTENSDYLPVTKTSFVHDNVYMLLYTLVDTTTTITGTKLSELKEYIPTTIQDEIKTENESFSVRFKLQEIKKQIVHLNVCLHSTTTNNSNNNNNNNSDRIELDVLQTSQLQTILEQIYTQFINENKLNSSNYPISQCRLRKYNKNNHNLGETYGDRMNLSLEELGLVNTVMLALEVRTLDDSEFIEYNPLDMYLSYIIWDTSSGSGNSTSSNNKYSILVPGRENTTVDMLRTAISTQLSVPTNRILLIHNNLALPIQILQDNNLILTNQVRIYPGDDTLVIEIIPEGCELETYASIAMPILIENRNKAIVYYNKPIEESASTNANATTNATTSTTTNATTTPTPIDENQVNTENNKDSNYPYSIEVSLDITLHDFKVLISSTLDNINVNSFYCKRNSSSTTPQLKDESKTLKDLAFVNHSIIHLQLGQVLRTGEHKLRIEIDPSSPTAALDCLTNTGNTEESSGIANNITTSTPSYIYLGDLSISEKSTILQLKQLLYDNWKNLLDINSNNDGTLPVTLPLSPNHIRLRDGKTGKISGPLRDDRIIGRCLLGLTDGRRLIAQLLPEPEYIKVDDLVISIRIVSFDKRILYPSIDLPITRSSNMKTLYNKILTLTPILQESLSNEYLEANPTEINTETISIAKGFTSGPPLTLKTAFKLKWDDPAVIKALYESNTTDESTNNNEPIEIITAVEAENQDIDEETLERSKNLGSVSGLDRPPLNLRDGSIVVVRNKSDFWRAAMIIRARKAAEEAAIAEEGGNNSGSARRPTTAGTGAAAARNRKSMKSRIIEANNNLNNNTGSDSHNTDEVLVKGQPKPERSLKISSGVTGKPPVPAENNINLSPSSRKVAANGDELEHSMEDLPPPAIE